MSIGTATDPLPDITVIKGTARDFLAEHPKAAALVVEVSDTTLDYDRTVKANLYAATGVTEYWIVNLRDAQVEVHRQPETTPTNTFKYRDVRHYQRGESVTAGALPDVQIAVADLQP